MTNPPRRYPELLERIETIDRRLLFDWSSRPMFGGAMVHADGKPVASLSDAGFAIKLPPGLQVDLLTVEGTRRLRYGPDKPESKSYIVLPDHVVADDAALADWLNTAADHVVPDRSSS